MKQLSLKNKKILVLGLGATGLSLLSFLSEQGAALAGFDAHINEEKAQTLEKKFPQITLFSGAFDKINLDDFDILALSPGVSSTTPKIMAFKEQGKPVVGDIELFAQQVVQTKAKVIAITGSNGKSTVTSMTGYLCEHAGLKTVVAGNIGLPVLDAWQQEDHNSVDVWVLELSSFQLDTTYSLNAAAACVLNISEDHLDRYTDLLDYAHSKSHVFTGCGVQILNLDDVFCRAMAREGRKIKYFSLEKETDYWIKKTAEDVFLFEDRNKIIGAKDLPVQGLHNVANTLAAFALCEAIGLNKEQLLPSLHGFKGLAHRVEKVGEKTEVLFIDDSKGTNVGATCAALNGFDAPVLLIAGGDGKGQDFSPLKEPLAQKARAVFLIGRDAQKIADACEGIATPFIFCKTLEEATQKAYEMACRKDIVLLSPACASWDMFDNYAHRSRVFIESFEQLKEDDAKK